MRTNRKVVVLVLLHAVVYQTQLKSEILQRDVSFHLHEKLLCKFQLILS